MFVDIQDMPLPPAPSVAPAVGIDFGTTFCGIAICQQEGSPTMIGPLIPSVIAYTQEILIGHRALDYPCIHSVKRHLEAPHVPVWGDKTPFQVATDLFLGLKAHMEQYAGAFIADAVITVPAYFDEAKRSVIKKAAQRAGFRVLRLLSEPTAAAISYQRQKEGLYGVYDLGGGTFDFSLLHLQQGLFRVLAIGGHSMLGGDDIDAAIEYKLYADQSVSAQRRGRSIKEDSFQKVLSPQEMEAIFQPFLEKTIEICQRTLDDAHVAEQDLQAILLVGGSTKSPYVQEYLRAHFQCPLDAQLHPDKAVAMGAAIQAYNLTQKNSFLLLDVAPLSLGIETWGGLVEVMIPRNSPLPMEKTCLFTTSQDGQTSIKVHVVQGEQELAHKCRSLGTFELSGLSPLEKGRVRIQVSFALDTDGLLSVSAREEHSDTHKNLVVNASDDLSYEYVISSIHKAGEDFMEKVLIQHINQASDALYEVRRLMALYNKDQLPTYDLLQETCIALESALVERDLARLQTQWDDFQSVAFPFIENHLTKRLKEHLEEKP